jgi:hypothetical protein
MAVMRARGWGLLAVTASLAAVLVVAPPAAAENVIAVTTTDDVVNGGDGVVSLREAFTIANGDADDSRIVLGVDLVYRLCDGESGSDEDANADGDLDHTEANALLIEGHGSEIRASCPGERVIHNLHVDGPIELVDLQVSGGDLGAASFSGSGLYSLGNAELTNVVVTDNTGGSGVEVGTFFTERTLTVTDSRITDNGAASRGGLHVVDGIAVVSSTEILFNQGPGIAATNESVLAVTECTIRQNGGGGISGVDGAVSVSGSVVRDNDGPGIRNTGNAQDGFPLSVVDTLVDNNAGGVECSFCTDFTITGSTIVDSHPRADGEGGSGVFFQHNQVGPFATITGTTIEGNRSGDPGGGVRVLGLAGVVPVITIDSTTISGNRTTAVFDGGGGIYAESVDLTIEDDSHVDGNFAKPEGILVGGDGGGIAQVGGELHLTGATVDDNFADTSGGGVHLSDVDEATFADASISGNTADGFGGGGVSSVGDAALLDFVRASVTDNTAQLAGGGVATSAAGVDVHVERSTIAGNASLASNGGGISANGTAIGLQLRNSTVSGNTAASGQGGGVLKLGSGTLDLRHATIVENTGAAVANLVLGGSAMDAFGTVVADALGGGDDCSTAFGSVDTDGFNFSGDDTCGFGAGPGDQDGEGDPGLGALDANGGPTDTHLPQPTSPLIGAITLASCIVETVDQRGGARPQGSGCEIGSVEVATPGAVGDEAGARSGESVRIRVLANDVDPDRVLDRRSLRILVKPRHGSARVQRGGVVYRSRRSFAGVDRFVYRVCAGSRRIECTRATVRVRVTR